ncbi:MAG: M42 family peptidase [Oscillospiraceae bacterium]|nr:M42 family peptidase [Oscillospiraceae bacterium]
MNELIRLLGDLCSLDGVSGDEGRVADYILSAVRPLGLDARTDRLGSVAVFLPGRDHSRRRMADAHMDEVGFLVTSVTDEGYLKLAPVGGLDPRVVPGKRLRVRGLREVLTAVVGVCPVHLAADPSAVRKIPELYADIGTSSGEEARRHVAPGCTAAFATEPERLGNGFFKAKAIDDRIGCAVLLHHLTHGIAPAFDTVFSFSTREEVGGAGAKGAAFSAAPDEALVLEGTTAADVPGVEGPGRVCLQNDGVVINIKDSTIYDREISARLRALADANGIRWQSKRVVAGGTNAASILPARGGIPTAGLSVPARYIHAPASTAALADCEAMLRLSRLYLES